jgi:hypothetical protein
MATKANWFRDRNVRLDPAMKAGIAATVCSVLMVALALLAMHTLPVALAVGATFTQIRNLGRLKEQSRCLDHARADTLWMDIDVRPFPEGDRGASSGAY